MTDLSHLSRGLALFVPMLLSMPATSARADQPVDREESSQTLLSSIQDTINEVDPIFGRIAVAPVAKVLFWDLAFWDNGRSEVTGAALGAEGLISVGADGHLVQWDSGAPASSTDYGFSIDGVLADPRRPNFVVLVAADRILSGRPDAPESMKTFPQPAGSPTVSALAEDGQRLVLGFKTGLLEAVSMDSGDSQTLFRSPGDEVSALATHGSTVAFAVGRELRSIHLRASAAKSTALNGSGKTITALAFSDEGSLAAGTSAGRLLIFAETGTDPVQTISTSNEAVVSLEFVGSSRLLVGRAGRVEVFDRKGPAEPFVRVRSLKATVSGMVADGDTLYTLRNQGQIGTHNLESGRPLAVLQGHATEIGLPVIVVWLVVGAVFFTLRFGFINVRAFGHAIAVTRGKYDTDHDEGDVSHFQALAMALSATVGLGNIAGVAVAVSAGGPGAVLWMIVAGFLGMSSKFAECTLGQMYRTTDAEGRVSGGPMHYLRTGLAELGLGNFGKFLSVLFAALCIMGSFGGGNMFQANQSYAQVANVVPALDNELGALMYGLILSGLVGVVIIGGIHRIGNVASFIVPFMVGIYLLAAFFIVFSNFSQIVPAASKIISGAFSPEAAYGGVLGVIITGFRRAAFSNEAGVGSASIAHSAAATKEPVREGIVALLEPFIDTVVVCTTTALVIVITDAYQTGDDGVVMTSGAFATVLPWFPKVLTVAVFLFAFSTMISWSYYGERCWTFLFGQGTAMVYRVLFVMAVILGSVIKLGSVLDFSDLMILAMAFPNILGAILLSGKVRANLSDYMGRLKSGAMVPDKTS